MPRGIFAFAVTAILFFSSAASAATLTTASSKDGKVIVTLDGEITEGDFDALKAIIKTANNGSRIVALIRLNSPGGGILEGVKIADMIRFGKISTSVIGTSTCASACFIIFAAGNEKYANYTASIGVHGASDESGEETTQSNAATVSMARIVKELGVPPDIIGKMVVTPPDQMVWLTPDELRSMGATMTGKPAQIPAEQPSTSQLSSQLGSQEKSTASSRGSPPPTWDKLLDTAIALSAQQNGGKPNIQRGCQPELKVCINALLFKGKDGADMIMKRTEDMDGKTLKKEVCSFNAYGDVRSCLNWDTGETERDMKNESGDWYQVGK